MAPGPWLVTGASGFLGGHVVPEQQQAGHAESTTARTRGDAADDLHDPRIDDAVTEAQQPAFVQHLAA